MSEQIAANVAPSAAGTPAHVLLVDDNRELVTCLKDILSAKGYRVSISFSAEPALQIISESPPDIIICDVMMPGRTGYDLQREVRRNPEWTDIPFIFLTAMTSSEDIQQGLESGCDDYLTKPFDPEELAAVVKGKLTIAAHRRRIGVSHFEGYRRRIIHTLSHEFRTPLVSINTGTELLLDSKHQLDGEHVRSLLESIHRGGQRLERLVNDFMILQQIDLGHAASSCERFRRRMLAISVVEMALDTFVESYFETPERPVIDFRFEGSEIDRSAEIDVYDVHVVHLLEHLLSNAAKFGGHVKPVELVLSVQPDEVTVLVRDYGQGMSAEMMARACEMFVQINRDVHEQQGAGLGLTIVRYFAKINGAKLDFRKPANETGLEVEIRFPRVR